MHPLLSWFDREKRDLPWRRTDDPYAIWVSEIMLQQTQVATVIPFWERWMARFPTVLSLANADEQDLLSLWQGLGYYRRARMLHAGAKFVVAHGMPKKAKAWLAVPGVGRYTAGAIASIAFGEQTPLVDGNVERVFARLTGSMSSGAVLHREAWDWASMTVHDLRPGDWNQALMELGATVCSPDRPRCSICPLQEGCVALRDGKTNQLPLRTIKPEVVRLTQYCFIPQFGNQFGVRQIPTGQWWEGMWEFPRADSEQELSAMFDYDWVEHVGRITHSVTNHRITLHVSLIKCESRSNTLRWVDATELVAIPMATPQRKALRLIDRT